MTANHKGNDYAGQIYKGRRERRVTGDRFGPLRKHQDDYNGVEFATTHLEKLMGSKAQFKAYWNDKKYGRYYWREAFMASMNLFFNK